MLREKNTFYMQTTEGQYLQFNRQKKASEQIKEYKSKIAHIQLQVRIAEKNGTATPEKIAQFRKEIARFERKIEQLEHNPTSHKRLKHHYNNMKHDVLKSELLKKLEVAKNRGWICVDAETLAYELNVKPLFVHQIFREFNVEGILSQPVHEPPHDNERSYLGGSLNGWRGDLYYFVCKDDE